MINISESAQTHFGKLLSQQSEATNIRVFVVNPGTSTAECGVSYCPADAVEETDVTLPFNGFNAVVDQESAPYLVEAEIDFVTDQMGSQLTLKAPNAKAKKLGDNASLVERINYMIETDVNPGLASHGGKVSLVEVTEDKTAILQFGGGCNGCSMVDVTLKNGIEKQMLVEFEGEIVAIKDATEHEAGEHSYY
ncbi:Fe-S biogenesis protein NfuA [Brumicola pallidula]|jgi:Fe/S biogenesis protein NfuA|uniref:Fe/S biogenesis protein NfuA n=1 Tax=Brumicola pallidula DSM 14239 = ACAM 615 TaxID=1121922 RepID=K6Y431_9ALTE|nr:Fe-S biogenesis protein NfuA [Glaciecola pallidula]GAC27554.1 Fe/S biogenesis protein NfuA [Glaciecola pallidula DSM 14239 = ACAM 615]